MCVCVHAWVGLRRQAVMKLVVYVPGKGGGATMVCVCVCVCVTELVVMNGERGPSSGHNYLIRQDILFLTSEPR